MKLAASPSTSATASTAGPRPSGSRSAARIVVLDRALEALPVFRLADSADDAAISYATTSGGRWRVLPASGERLPGTLDQDVYIELMRRYTDAGAPADGVVTFRLHAFLRSIARRADGRTYEQLRSALGRLRYTTLVSSHGAHPAGGAATEDTHTFTLLSALHIERRRDSQRDQMPLFGALAASEPGDASVTISPAIRANIAAGHTTALSLSLYQRLGNPVARRLYRLLAIARAEERGTWRVELERLAEQIPLTQRYPSQLQRVLQPAHEMLVAAGILRNAAIQPGASGQRQWMVEYILGTRGTPGPATRNIVPA